MYVCVCVCGYVLTTDTLALYNGNYICQSHSQTAIVSHSQTAIVLEWDYASPEHYEHHEASDFPSKPEVQARPTFSLLVFVAGQVEPV